jgi:hypothetical protein
VKAILLDILATVSVLIVGLLAAGFMGRWDVAVLHASLARSPVAFQVVELGVDRGRVVDYWSRASGAAAVPPRLLAMPDGFSFLHTVRIWPPRPLDRRRAVWEFDAHFMSGGSGPSTFILACPIWCAIVPFLIPPTLWLRKRRRRREISRGFAVENVTPSVDVVRRR